MNPPEILGTFVPLFPLVTVDLGGGNPRALQIIDQVTEALDRAGQHEASDAFLRAAHLADTDEELLALADSLVTLIL